MIRGVLLDVGGVLLLPEPATVAEIFGVPSVTPEAMRRAHYRAIATMDAAGQVDYDIYWRSVATSIDAAADAVDRAVADLRGPAGGLLWTHPLEAGIEGLEQLAKTGLPLGIVSNANGQIADLLVDAAICQRGDGPLTAVDVLVDSHHVGVEKPDPRIFEIALAELGLPADAAVHVGDTVLADVVGARSAGVQPLHLDPYDDCPRRGDHEHLRTLGELVPLLDVEPAARSGSGQVT